MKLLKYGLPLVALGIMASCSNDNDVAPGVTPEPVPSDAMYISFNLSLPEVSGTRVSNKGYDDGEENEYAIHNIYLHLFRADVKNNSSAGEAEARFFKSYQIGFDEEDWTDGGGNPITGKQKVTFQITGLNEQALKDYDFYGLIVVNQPSDTHFSAPTEASEASEATLFSTWNTNTIMTASNRHYDGAPADVISMIPTLDGTEYFTMTNAPLYDEEEKTVTYLRKLEEDQFKKSPEQAQKAAATFYVQRGVAKVALDNDDFEDFDVSNDDEATVDVLGWALDVTNLKTYPVQQVEEATAFDGTSEPKGIWSADHFLSTSYLENTYQHIYWSKDPNYSATYNTQASSEFNYIANNIQWNDPTFVEYCLENTMTEKSMQKTQSTRAVFKCHYKLDGETVSSFLMYPGTDLAYAIPSTVTINSQAQSSDDPTTYGMYSLKELISDSDELAKAKVAMKMANDADFVYYYPNGVTYYSAIIRHFDNDEAGLDEDNYTYETLENYQNKQLGRYGLVRNNSYAMNITGFQGFGLPFIPTTPPDPDDKPDPVKYNVMLEINVLNWTKRSYPYTPK